MFSFDYPRTSALKVQKVKTVSAGTEALPSNNVVLRICSEDTYWHTRTLTWQTASEGARGQDLYVKWGGEAGRRGGAGCRADGAASAADCSRVISADRRARRSGGETLRLRLRS